MVNRYALILRYAEPAVRWINEADPHGSSDTTTLDEVNEERTVYLIDERSGADSERLEHWLKENYRQLFEMELEGWYTDPDCWPAERTYELFRQWFVPELHSVLIDLAYGEIFDDEA